MYMNWRSRGGASPSMQEGRTGLTLPQWPKSRVAPPVLPAPVAITNIPLIHTSWDVQQAGTEGVELQPWQILVTWDHCNLQHPCNGHWCSLLPNDQPKNGPQASQMQEEGQIQWSQSWSPLPLYPTGVFSQWHTGSQTTMATKQLALLLSTKKKCTYSKVCGFTWSCLSVALAHLASRCLRAVRDPPITWPNTDWVAGTSPVHIARASSTGWPMTCTQQYITHHIQCMILANHTLTNPVQSAHCDPSKTT